jgi:lambda family phage portal protein
MGIKDKLVQFTDGYYEVVNPQKAASRKLARSAMSYKHGKARRSGPQASLMTGSGNAHMPESEMTTLREKVRLLDRDNYIVKSIIDRMIDFTIGNGINVQINSPNKRWNDRAERLWNEYWNGSPEVRGMMTGPELERVIYRTKKIDGDVLIIKTNDGRLQVIEADQIRNPNGQQDSDKNIINGVEVDPLGLPKKFYIYPHDDKRGRNSKVDPVVVDAKDCIFLAERHRVSMTRGVTSFSSCIDLFEDIDGFIEASVVQQKVSASHAMVIEQKGGPSALETNSVTDTEGLQYSEEDVRTGSILYLNVGEQAKVLGAQQSGQQFGPFVTQMLRFAGLPFGLPLELTSLDFSKTNYSSARASLQVAHKNFVREHRRMVSEFMEPIVRWFLESKIESGELDERKYKISATPPKGISVDPLKEANADIVKILSGLSTLKDVAVSNGQDWEELLRQRESEIVKASKIAQNVVKQTDEEWSARDILGMTKDFKKEIFTDETEQVVEDDGQNQDSTE